MSSSKRSKASAAILVAALVVFTSIAVYQASLLQWPLFQALNQIVPPPKHNIPPKSSLLITAFEQVPVSILSNNGSFFSSTTVLPIPQAFITVGTLVGSIFENLNSNYTNSNGVLFVYVPAGNYKVSLRSSISNDSAFVTAYGGNTTELDILVNETFYSSSFFEIANPSSSGELPPWNPVYLHVHSTSSIIQNANDSVYLTFSPASELIDPFFSFPNSDNLLGLQIMNEFTSSSDGTLWLQVHLNSPTDISNVTKINLITFDTTFATRIFPLQNSSSVPNTS